MPHLRRFEPSNVDRGELGSEVLGSIDASVP